MENYFDTRSKGSIFNWLFQKWDVYMLLKFNTIEWVPHTYNNNNNNNNNMYIGFHNKHPLEVPYQNYLLMYCLVVWYHGQRFLQV